VGDTVRHTQSGNVRSYAVWVIIGAIVILAIVFWPLWRPAFFVASSGGVR